MHFKVAIAFMKKPPLEVAELATEWFCSNLELILINDIARSVGMNHLDDEPVCSKQSGERMHPCEMRGSSVTEPEERLRRGAAGPRPGEALRHWKLAIEPGFLLGKLCTFVLVEVSVALEAVKGGEQARGLACPGIKRRNNEAQELHGLERRLS